MAQAEHPQSWSDLPTELAGLVLCCLPAYSDRVRFGAVCRHWSFSSAEHRLPAPLPCLMFHDGTFVCLPLVESFQFPGIASYHSSCSEWLVFLHDGNCYLKNPFSKVTLTLPNLSCLCPIDEPVEIINGRVSPEEEMPQESLNMYADMSIDKVIVCSPHLVAAIANIGPLSTLALCRPGAEPWFISRVGSKLLLLDMVFMDGNLYVIDEYKDLLAIEIGEEKDSGNPMISQIKRLVESPCFSISLVLDGFSDIRHFLVECHGALLLVRRTIFGSLPAGAPPDGEDMLIDPLGIEFQVFEAEINSSRWVHVTSVGDDQALFLGRNHSQSVCMSQYKLKGGMLRGNRIMFLDDGTCNWFWKGITGSVSIYDMSDGMIYTPNPPGLFQGRNVPATWLFPQ